jgi:hypothetical protein
MAELPKQGLADGRVAVVELVGAIHRPGSPSWKSGEGALPMKLVAN